MVIRRLDPEDLPLLEEAVRDLLLPDHPGRGPGPASHLARALADPNCYFIVCSDGTRAVGYLSAFRFPDVEGEGCLVYLYDVVVRPDDRRRGVGARLLDELGERCRADGVRRIWAGTSLENHAARRLLEGAGARRVSETYIEYILPLGEEPADEPGR